MRKILTLFLLLAIGHATAQNPNPTSGFSGTVTSANPSVYLNFNDATTSFKDMSSGLNFGPGAQVLSVNGSICGNSPTSSTSSTSCTITTASSGDTLVFFVGDVVPSTIISLTDSLGSTSSLVTTNGNLTVWTFANVPSGAHTFTLTLSSAASFPILQGTDIIGAALTSPVDAFNTNIVTSSSTTFTSNSITTTVAPQEMLIGWVLGTTNTFTLNSGFARVGSSLFTGIFPAKMATDIKSTYSFSGTQTNTSGYTAAVVAIKPRIQTSAGTAMIRQTGFDLTQPNNTSAGFPFNTYNSAPNNTLGDFEWSSPTSILIHIDRLNWARTGTLVLASKGDLSIRPSWELLLQMNGLFSQLCFVVAGSTTIGSPNSSNTAGAVTCSASNLDIMPNGYNYDIVVTNNGSGAVGGTSLPTAWSLFVNGLNVGSTASSSFQFGFNPIGLTVSGGTGYAASTSFTSSGGGTNCTATGSFASSGGVPTGVVSWTQDFGCTSLPTINLVSSTGTGATITPTGPFPSTMSTATSFPLMVPGSISNGTASGISQATTTQPSTFIDEFAIFPSALTATQIGSLYYHSKFYQSILGAVPATPPLVIVDEDGCNDLDNLMVMTMAIRLNQLGYIHLIGTISEDSAPDPAMWRQMLDQAGLSNVPVGVTSQQSGQCLTTNLTKFNASTSQVNSTYPSAATVYRTLFTKYSTTPIKTLVGGAFTGMARFMESSADSISTLTGQQLFNQNGTNGGSLYGQGSGCIPTGLPQTTPCAQTLTGGNEFLDFASGQEVFNNNGTTPIFMTGGSPPSVGPGMLATRTKNDPMFLATSLQFGIDTRQCFDCMAMSEMVTPIMMGGVELSVTGGTGYANSTAFTSTGGGAGCSVTGTMTSASGIPTGAFTYTFGTALNTFTGIGSGCTSAPTIVLTAPTGSGAVITAFPTSVCGTETITSATAGATTSATCSNHFFQPPSYFVGISQSGFIWPWFVNSLLDTPPQSSPRIN
jgi:hypothetical protein